MEFMDNIIALFVFQIAVLVFSVVIHEVSHGAIAERLGDPTARLLGRITLNPLKHLDPFGSFVVPVVLWFLSSGTFIIGWAKPVPFNPWNLKNPIAAAAKIAAAGPAANILIALAFGIVVRFWYVFGPPQIFLFLFSIIVEINILLAIFNLVPIPPLDGSKILYALLPRNEAGAAVITFLERFGLWLLLLFIFFGFDFIVPIVQFVFTLFTGLRL
jgi:Zn-dependent protease